MGCARVRAALALPHVYVHCLTRCSWCALLLQRRGRKKLGEASRRGGSRRSSLDSRGSQSSVGSARSHSRNRAKLGSRDSQRSRSSVRASAVHKAPSKRARQNRRSSGGRGRPESKSEGKKEKVEIPRLGAGFSDYNDDENLTRSARRRRSLIRVNRYKNRNNEIISCVEVAGTRRRIRPKVKKGVKKTAQQRMLELLDDASWLVEINLEWQEPRDEATEAITEAADELVRAEEAAERASTSYFPDFVEREFRKAVPAAVKAVGRAYPLLVARAHHSVDVAEERLHKMQALEASGVDIEGGRDKALELINTAAEEVRRAEEAKAVKEADTTRNYDLVDEFIARALIAKKALRQVGTLLRQRKQVAIDEAEAEMERAAHKLDDAVAKNALLGRPDDHVNNTLDGAQARYDGARRAHEEMMFNADMPELVDVFLSAARGLEKDVDAALEATGGVWASGLNNAAERLAELRARLRALQAAADGEDGIDSHVLGLIAAADAALDAAEEDHEEWKRDSEDPRLSLAFQNSVNSAGPPVDAVAEALRGFMSHQLVELRVRIDYVKERWEEFSRLHELAGSPEDEATILWNSLTEYVATLNRLYEVAYNGGGNVDMSAVGEIMSTLDSAEPVVDETDLAFTTRHKLILTRANGVQADAQHMLDEAETRNHRAGAPRDEASAILALARGKVKASGTMKRTLASTGQLRSSVLWDYVKGAEGSRNLADKALKAVLARLGKLVHDHRALVAELRRKVDAFDDSRLETDDDVAAYRDADSTVTAATAGLDELEHEPESLQLATEFWERLRKARQAVRRLYMLAHRRSRMMCEKLHEARARLEQLTTFQQRRGLKKAAVNITEAGAKMSVAEEDEANMMKLLEEDESSTEVAALETKLEANVGLAEESVSSVERVMRGMLEQEAKSMERQVAAAGDKLELVITENKSMGFPDDEPTQLVAHCQQLRRNLATNPPDDLMTDASATWMSASEDYCTAVDESARAVAARQASLVAQARKRMKTLARRLEELRARQSSQGTPSHRARSRLMASVEAREAAEKAGDAGLDSEPQPPGSKSAYYLSCVTKFEEELKVTDTFLSERNTELVAEIEAAKDSLLSSASKLAQLQERNKHANVGEDQVSQALSEAAESVTTGRTLAKLVVTNPVVGGPVEDLLTTAAEAKARLDAAASLMDERELAARQSVLLELTLRVKDLKKSLREAEVRNNALGAPDDRATELVLKASDEVQEAAAAVKAAVDGAGRGEDVDESVAAELTAALNRAETVLGDAASAVRVREEKVVVDMVSELGGMSAQLATLEEANAKAGKPDDEATQAIHIAHKRVKTAKKARNELRSQLNTPELVSALYKSMQPVPDAVAKATQALEGREAASVEVPRRQLEQLQKELREVEARNNIVGSPLDETTAWVTAARKSVDAADAQVNVHTPEDAARFRADVAKCADRVQRAAGAVHIREEGIVVDSISTLTTARAELEALTDRYGHSQMENEVAQRTLDDAAAALAVAEKDKETVRTQRTTPEMVARLRDHTELAVKAMAAAKHAVASCEAASSSNLVDRIRNADSTLRDAEARNNAVGNPNDATSGLVLAARTSVNACSNVQQAVGDGPQAQQKLHALVTKCEVEVAAACEAVAKRERKVLMDKAAELREAKRDLTTLENRNEEAGAPQDDATSQLQVAKRAAREAEDANSILDQARTGSGGRRGGAEEVGDFVSSVDTLTRAVSKATRAMSGRSSDSAAAEAQARLVAIRAQLEKLQERDQAAGSPDDDAHGLLDEAQRQVEQCETLGEKVGTQVPGNGSPQKGRGKRVARFKKAVPVADKTVQAAANAIRRREEELLLDNASELASWKAKLQALQAEHGNSQDARTKAALERAAKAVEEADRAKEVVRANLDQPEALRGFLEAMKPVQPACVAALEVAATQKAADNKAAEHKQVEIALATATARMGDAHAMLESLRKEAEADPDGSAARSLAACEAAVADAQAQREAVEDGPYSHASVGKFTAAVQKAVEEVDSARGQMETRMTQMASKKASAKALSNANATGALAVARSRLDALVAENRDAENPSDGATSALSRAKGAVASAESLQQNVGKPGFGAEFDTAFQAAVAKAASEVRKATLAMRYREIELARAAQVRSSSQSGSAVLDASNTAMAELRVRARGSHLSAGLYSRPEFSRSFGAGALAKANAGAGAGAGAGAQSSANGQDMADAADAGTMARQLESKMRSQPKSAAVAEEFIGSVSAFTGSLQLARAAAASRLVKRGSAHNLHGDPQGPQMANVTKAVRDLRATRSQLVALQKSVDGRRNSVTTHSYAVVTKLEEAAVAVTAAETIQSLVIGAGLVDVSKLAALFIAFVPTAVAVVLGAVELVNAAKNGDGDEALSVRALPPSAAQSSTEDEHVGRVEKVLSMYRATAASVEASSGTVRLDRTMAARPMTVAQQLIAAGATLAEVLERVTPNLHSRAGSFNSRGEVAASDELAMWKLLRHIADQLYALTLAAELQAAAATRAIAEAKDDTVAASKNVKALRGDASDGLAAVSVTIADAKAQLKRAKKDGRYKLHKEEYEKAAEAIATSEKENKAAKAAVKAFGKIKAPSMPEYVEAVTHVAKAHGWADAALAAASAVHPNSQQRMARGMDGVEDALAVTANNLDGARVRMAHVESAARADDHQTRALLAASRVADDAAEASADQGYYLIRTTRKTVRRRRAILPAELAGAAAMQRKADLLYSAVDSTSRDAAASLDANGAEQTSMTSHEMNGLARLRIARRKLTKCMTGFDSLVASSFSELPALLMHRTENCVFESERSIHEADDTHDQLRSARRVANARLVTKWERQFVLKVAKAVILVDELADALALLRSQRGAARGQRGLVTYNYSLSPWHNAVTPASRLMLRRRRGANAMVDHVAKRGRSSFVGSRNIQGLVTEQAMIDRYHGVRGFRDEYIDIEDRLRRAGRAFKAIVLGLRAKHMNKVPKKTGLLLRAGLQEAVKKLSAADVLLPRADKRRYGHRLTLEQLFAFDLAVRKAVFTIWACENLVVNTEAEMKLLKLAEEERERRRAEGELDDGSGRSLDRDRGREGSDRRVRRGSGRGRDRGYDDYDDRRDDRRPRRHDTGSRRRSSGGQYFD